MLLITLPTEIKPIPATQQPHIITQYPIPMKTNTNFGYSDKNYAAEKDKAQTQTTAAQLHAKEELTRFNMVVMLEYEKDLK
jgi:hypothetical protein